VSDGVLHGGEQPLLATLSEEARPSHDVTVLP
jgi:hypothetical protein